MEIAIVIGCIIVCSILALGISAALVIGIFFNYIRKIIKDEGSDD